LTCARCAPGRGAVQLCRQVERLRQVTPRLISAADVRRLPLEVEESLFRVAQEALRNAVKHAQAKQITLDLSIVGDWLVLSVADDGCGFDAQALDDGRAVPLA